MTIPTEQRLRSVRQLRIASKVFLPLGIVLFALGLFLLTQNSGPWLVVLLLGAVFIFQSFVFRRNLRAAERDLAADAVGADAHAADAPEEPPAS